MRLIVAALKITNDLERIGDLAGQPGKAPSHCGRCRTPVCPKELAPWAIAVRAMVSKSLGALIFRNVRKMATQVLESDDVVDQYRDRISFENFAGRMTQQALCQPRFAIILATRHLERIADHAPNRRNIQFLGFADWDVRHGRA